MTVRDVILMTYSDAAWLVVGIVASWVAIALWASSDREDRWTPWHLLAALVGFAAGFGLGWFARGISA